MNTAVAHPQANGLVERANRSLMEGIKTRLGREKAGWVDELPNVLWAHRTSIKQSNKETPFSLTYGSEAVIPAEIGIHTYRTMMIREGYNEEEIRLNLVLVATSGYVVPAAYDIRPGLKDLSRAETYTLNSCKKERKRLPSGRQYTKRRWSNTTIGGYVRHRRAGRNLRSWHGDSFARRSRVRINFQQIGYQMAKAAGNLCNIGIFLLKEFVIHGI
ncbi:reverse transcriptase domain-containing protein [Tanacetum coccineum]